MHIYQINIHTDGVREDHRINIMNSEIYIIDPNFSENLNECLPIDEDHHNKKYGFVLSESEINNFMAHRKVWKQFLETDNPWCLIVENNVDMDTEIQAIQSTIDNLPDDCELFFPYDPREYKSTTNNKVININRREFFDEESYFMGFQWGNSIYLVNRCGAEKLYGIDIIKNRLDDEILILSSEEKLTVYMENVTWLEYNAIEWIVPQDRKQLIWEAICGGSSWTSLRKKRVKHLLKVMSQVAEELAIDLILERGSHLGYVRHGGIMIWDDDVDIGIEENDLQSFLDGLSKVDGICHGQRIEPHTEVPYYKVWSSDGEKIENYHYTFPFVDLWIFNKVGNDLVFKNGIICQNSAICDFMDVTFEGAKFKLPYNSLEILDSRYQDWRKKIRIYTWSHCYERHRFRPLHLNIEVDATGRFLGF